MTLEKVTKWHGRRYADACGAALGMELLGERWALLVVRELMLGPRRFTDLRAALPGLSANVLSQRLDELEAAGVLTRRRLPPPASVQVYELTPWGLEVEPVLQALGRWAARSPHLDPTLPLSPVSMMLSLRTMFDRAAAGDARAAIGFRLDGEGFVVTVADGAVTAVRAEPETAQVAAVVTGRPTDLAAVVYGNPSTVAERTWELLRVEGDRDAFLRFTGWFALPTRIEG